MTSDFEGFSVPDFNHYIYFPILILEKEPVFPFLIFSAKQGNYWYHFNNVFGMTRPLTGTSRSRNDLTHLFKNVFIYLELIYTNPLGAKTLV